MNTKSSIAKQHREAPASLRYRMAKEIARLVEQGNRLKALRRPVVGTGENGGRVRYEVTQEAAAAAAGVTLRAYQAYEGGTSDIGADMKRPRWRKSTWALIIWTVLIIAWAVGGAGAADCGSETGDEFISAETAQSACEAGAGIGVLLILFIGFFGFVFLSLIWFMTRTKSRECPICGNGVKKGKTVCGSCGYDFATAARPQTTA